MGTIARSNTFCRRLVLLNDYQKYYSKFIPISNSFIQLSTIYQLTCKRWTHTIHAHSLCASHCSKSVSKFSVRPNTRRAFSQEAYHQHLDPSLLEQYIELKDFDSEELVKFFEFMSIYGYNIHQSAQMVIRYPDILSNYESDIPKTTSIWRNLGYEEKDTIRILYRHPTLVLLQQSKLIKRFSFLTQFFSRKETLEGIHNNIALVTDNQDILKGKIKYLIEKAGHRPESIAKSKVLSKTLHHILVRHEILIRSGLYKVVELKKLHKQGFYTNPYAPRERYFTVSEITCTGDREFLKKCTDDQISLNELIAFDEMLEASGEKDKLIDKYEDNNEEDGESYGSDDEDRRASDYFSNEKEAQEFYF